MRARVLCCAGGGVRKRGCGHFRVRELQRQSQRWRVAMQAQVVGGVELRKRRHMSRTHASPCARGDGSAVMGGDVVMKR